MPSQSVGVRTIDVKCPRCGARPGVDCRRPSGVTTWPHKARQQAHPDWDQKRKAWRA